MVDKIVIPKANKLLKIINMKIASIGKKLAS